MELRSCVKITSRFQSLRAVVLRAGCSAIAKHPCGTASKTRTCLPFTIYHLPLTTCHLPLTTYHLPLALQGEPMPDIAQALPKKYLSFWTKLVYGTGDWGTAGYGTLRQIFYAIFLTDVVGLEPRLASVAALLGIAWDAINDPLVGMISDRARTRWGRRRPFLLVFAIPFG